LAGSFVARRRSFFLHRTAWLELGFAKQLSGPDADLGQGGTETKERWSVAYVPEVDTRLAELSAEGASVEEAASRKLAELAYAAEGRASDIATLVGRAVLMGLEGTCRGLIPELSRALAASTDVTSLLGAGRRLRRIAAWRARLVREPAPWLETLGREAYEQGVRGLSRLLMSRVGRAAEVLALLVDLRDATLLGDDMAPARALVVSKVSAMRSAARALSPLLLGALDGLLVSLDALAASELGADFNRVACGSDKPEAKGLFLEGLLALSPRALSDEPPLLEALVTYVTRGSFDGFLASLPSLRRALARLDARELEDLSARAASRIGLRTPELPLVTPLPPNVIAQLSTWELRFLAEEAEWAGPPEARVKADPR
jgi:hypothetical protein